MRSGPEWRWIGAVALILLYGASCSRRPADVPEAVILYCAQDQVFAEPILAEFTRQTGIQVNSVYDSEAVKTVGLANRLLAERRHPVADVFWGNEELRTRQLAAAGVFRETNGWVAFGQRSRRLVVHPDRRLSSPSSLRDLTNSQWRGRISLAIPLFGTTATHFLVLRQAWGETNWLTWCQALAANQPFLEEGNSHVVRRVARGEAWFGLTDSDDLRAAQREGWSVASLFLGPDELLIPNTVGLVAREGSVRAEVQRLFDYLQGPFVRAELIRVGALEAEGLASTRVDWHRLVRELEAGTAQLHEVFGR